MVMKLVMVDPSKSGKDKVRSNTFHHFKKSETVIKQEKARIHKGKTEYTPIMLHRFVQDHPRMGNKKASKVSLNVDSSLATLEPAPGVGQNIQDDAKSGNSAAILNLNINRQGVPKAAMKSKASENKYHYDPFIIKRSEPNTLAPEISIPKNGSRNKIKRKIKFVNKPAINPTSELPDPLSHNIQTNLESENSIPHTSTFIVSPVSKKSDVHSKSSGIPESAENTLDEPTGLNKNLLHSSNLKLLLQNESKQGSSKVTKGPDKPLRKVDSPDNSSNSGKGYSTFTFKIDSRDGTHSSAP